MTRELAFLLDWPWGLLDPGARRPVRFADQLELSADRAPHLCLSVEGEQRAWRIARGRALLQPETPAFFYGPGRWRIYTLPLPRTPEEAVLEVARGAQEAFAVRFRSTPAPRQPEREGTPDPDPGRARAVERMLGLLGALRGERPDDPLFLGWEAVARCWLAREAAFEPRLAVIVRHARTLRPLLTELAEHPRQVLRREHRLMPLSRAQEWDRRALLWYARRPGRTPAEKAGPGQTVLALAREESRDTLENRVLRHLLELSRRAAGEWCDAHVRLQGSERFVQVERYGRVSGALARELARAPVGLPAAELRPNYPLLFDARYRRVWAGYRELLHERWRRDEVRRWAHRLFDEVVRILVRATLVVPEVAQARPLEPIGALPLVLRGEQERGRFAAPLASDLALIAADGTCALQLFEPAQGTRYHESRAGAVVANRGRARPAPRAARNTAAGVARHPRGLGPRLAAGEERGPRLAPARPAIARRDGRAFDRRARRARRPGLRPRGAAGRGGFRGERGRPGGARPPARRRRPLPGRRLCRPQSDRRVRRAMAALSEPIVIGLDLDDVVLRAATAAADVVARPAVRVRLPGAGRRSLVRALALPSAFTDGAIGLLRADASRVCGIELDDGFSIWRKLADKEPPRPEIEALRGIVQDLLGAAGAGSAAQVVVAIADPSSEEAQERRLSALAGLGPVQLAWRSVLALLGLVAHAPDRLPGLPAEVLVVELGWDRLRANRLALALDEESGIPVPERRGPGIEIRWAGPSPPSPEHRFATRWERDREGRLVPAASGRPPLPADAADAVARAAASLAETLRNSASGAAASERTGLWLVEGALAGASCGEGRLGEAVIRGLSRLLPAPRRVEIRAGETGLVVRGAAECARRLLAGLPAWWDRLPQLEINRVNERGRVEFVPLVDAVRVRGDGTYTNRVTGFALPAGARELNFVLVHQEHAHARRLVQPLPRPLPREVPVALEVRQRPARGRARVDVVPLEATADFPRRLALDWQRLADTAWDRAAALRELERTIEFAHPPVTRVPADLWSWYGREQRLADLLRRLLDQRVGSPACETTVKACLARFRPRRPPDGNGRVAPVGSDGELPAGLSEQARFIFEQFRARLARDIQALPRGDRRRRRLVLLGAWLYAAAPEAVREELVAALRTKALGASLVQAAGRCLADEPAVRLFFARCAEACLKGHEHTNWMKALGQILIYREQAASWLDGEGARRCLFGTVRQLERAVTGRLAPQRFNNAMLALLGLLRVRTHLPGFLLGGEDDPVPEDVRRTLEERLRRLVPRLDAKRAELVREVLRYLEGKGTNQLIAASFDEAEDAALDDRPGA